MPSTQGAIQITNTNVYGKELRKLQGGFAVSAENASLLKVFALERSQVYDIAI